MQYCITKAQLLCITMLCDTEMLLTFNIIYDESTLCVHMKIVCTE